MQRGIQRPALHRESVFLADPDFPGQGLDPLEQLLKGTGGEAAEMDLNPFGIAGADIGPGQQLHIAGEQHPAVFRPDIFRPHPPQLVAQNPLDAEQAGGAKFHVSHVFLSFPSPGRSGQTNGAGKPARPH